MNLCDYNTLRALLSRHGFHFSRTMGQNFLIDPRIPAGIADASGAGPGWGVLEIGPGAGCLTRELSARAERVAAVELDRKLLPVLAETLAGCPNVTVIPGDVLRLDWCRTWRRWRLIPSPASAVWSARICPTISPPPS